MPRVPVAKKAFDSLGGGVRALSGDTRSAKIKRILRGEDAFDDGIEFEIALFDWDSARCDIGLGVALEHLKSRCDGLFGHKGFIALEIDDDRSAHKSFVIVQSLRDAVSAIGARCARHQNATSKALNMLLDALVIGQNEDLAKKIHGDSIAMGPLDQRHRADIQQGFARESLARKASGDHRAGKSWRKRCRFGRHVALIWVVDRLTSSLCDPLTLCEIAKKS